VQVSDPLAKILDRMIGQYPIERYTKAAQVLEDLKIHQSGGKPGPK
jgi:hypothetical protein